LARAVVVNSSVAIFINISLLDGKAQYTITAVSISTTHAIATGNKRRSISRSDILVAVFWVVIGVIILIISL
jgi:hypothetical protein